MCDKKVTGKSQSQDSVRNTHIKQTHKDDVWAIDCVGKEKWHEKAASLRR
jgi:hypothetical protein